MNNDIESVDILKTPIETLSDPEPQFDFHEHPIYSRPDGTFVITHMGNPYHVTKDYKFAPAGLWEAVTAYVAENPDSVQPEPPRPELDPPETEPTPNCVEIANVFFNCLIGDQNDIFQQLLSAGTKPAEANRLIGEAAAANLKQIAQGLEPTATVLETALKPKKARK